MASDQHRIKRNYASDKFVLIVALICFPLLPAIQREQLPVPVLIALLDSKIAMQRENAAYELGLHGEKAEIAVVKLLQLLEKDADEGVRLGACYGLARVGKKDRKVIIALAETMQQGSATLRSSAASALGEIGTNARDAVPALYKALKDEDRWVRGNAGVALSAVLWNNDTLVALEDMLKDKSATVRVQIGINLLLRRPTKQAYVTLVRAIHIGEELRDDDEKEAQTFALGYLKNHIDEKHAPMVDALIDALVDKDPYIRQCAAHSLGSVGAPAKRAIPWLKRTFKDDNVRARDNAKEAIEKIEPATKK